MLTHLFIFHEMKLCSMKFNNPGLNHHPHNNGKILNLFFMIFKFFMTSQ